MTTDTHTPERRVPRERGAAQLGSYGQCTACGQTAGRHLYDVQGFSIVACNDCELARTLLPSGFDLASVYSEQFFQGGQTNGYADYAGSRDILVREFRTILARLAEQGIKRGSLLEI